MNNITINTNTQLTPEPLSSRLRELTEKISLAMLENPGITRCYQLDCESGRTQLFLDAEQTAREFLAHTSRSRASASQEVFGQEQCG